MKDIFTLAIVIAIVVALVAMMPLAIIWSLNTLFGFTIAFTVKNWCAALILGGVVGGTKASRKSN